MWSFGNNYMLIFNSISKLNLLLLQISICKYGNENVSAYFWNKNFEFNDHLKMLQVVFLTFNKNQILENKRKKKHKKQQLHV